MRFHHGGHGEQELFFVERAARTALTISVCKVSRIIQGGKGLPPYNEIAFLRGSPCPPW